MEKCRNFSRLAQERALTPFIPVVKGPLTRLRIRLLEPPAGSRKPHGNVSEILRSSSLLITRGDISSCELSAQI